MRVKKKVYANGSHANTVIFVYSGGKLVEEFAITPPQNPKTKYLTKDHLGTPRIITDGIGQVGSRRDFMPFGEDLGNTVGARTTSSMKYASSEDDVSQKFTGYQKDEETQLDFAEARMYENRHARFTAVDPLLASGKNSNPQTFNRFVYVGNNPMNITDPLGLDWYFSEANNNYRWFKDKAEDGYKKVDFGGASNFWYTACVVDDCSIQASHILWDDGSNSWDTNSLMSSLGVGLELDPFRQLDYDSKVGVGIGFRNSFRGLANCLVECNFAGSPVDFEGGGYLPSFPAGLSLEKLGVPKFFDYEKPANTTQQVFSGATQIGMAALTTKGVGLTRTAFTGTRSVMGVSQVRPNGSVNTLVDGGMLGQNSRTLVVTENHFKDVKNVFKEFNGRRNVFQKDYWQHVLPHKHKYTLELTPVKLNDNFRKTFEKGGATKETFFRWQKVN